MCEFFPLVHPPSEQFILDYANDIGIVRGYVQLYVISMKIESNVNLLSLGDSQDKKQKTDGGQKQFTCSFISGYQSSDSNKFLSNGSIYYYTNAHCNIL